MYDICFSESAYFIQDSDLQFNSFFCNCHSCHSSLRWKTSLCICPTFPTVNNETMNIEYCGLHDFGINLTKAIGNKTRKTCVQKSWGSMGCAAWWTRTSSTETKLFIVNSWTRKQVYFIKLNEEPNVLYIVERRDKLIYLDEGLL